LATSMSLQSVFSLLLLVNIVLSQSHALSSNCFRCNKIISELFLNPKTPVSKVISQTCHGNKHCVDRFQRLQLPSTLTLASFDLCHQLQFCDKISPSSNNNFPIRTRPQGSLNSNIWESCSEIPVLGQTCLAVYAIPTNLTLGVELSINNVSLLNLPLAANKLCLDEAALLQLLALTPPLIPFLPLIEALIIIDKFIPATVFSVCLKFYNLSLTKHEAKGCSMLDSVLICWMNDCVWKGEVQFGCWDVLNPFGPRPQQIVPTESLPKVKSGGLTQNSQTAQQLISRRHKNSVA